MFELEELRKRIEEQDYISALRIIDELEEMSKEDKLNKIYSYMVILLIHLIKQEVENRTTNSWDRSIYNSLKQINRTNKRRKSGGFYADEAALKEIIDEAFDHALKEASYEAMEGKLTTEMLAKKINCSKIKAKALTLAQNL